MTITFKCLRYFIKGKKKSMWTYNFCLVNICIHVYLWLLKGQLILKDANEKVTIFFYGKWKWEKYLLKMKESRQIYSGQKAKRKKKYICKFY